MFYLKKQDPNKEIFDNIKNYITLWKNRTNILLVIHSDFRKDASDNCGGTQMFYLKKQDINFFHR